MRSRSGQPCSLCRAVDLRVLRPARRIHIRRRGRVLHNSPPPASVRSAGGPDRDRAWHLWSSSSRDGVPRPRAPLATAFGGSLRSGDTPLPAPSLPASSRRYAPPCFVGGIPPSRLATCTTAHPPNRAVSCRSARHSAHRPASSLHVKPIQTTQQSLSVRARTRWGCFGGMRSDDEKDGSDPILTRRHFAERLDGTGKM